METVEPTFGINGFWIVISALNFVLVVAVLYAVVRLARWLLVGRPRERAEVRALRERVAHLEAAQAGRASGDPSAAAGPDAFAQADPQG